jgi:glycosyltransferase involved in cell wall biosynthesis
MNPHDSLPTVSVVIRTRNEAPRLRLTLASLASQGAHEVIVVDDASSDETPRVVEAAAPGAATPVRLVRHVRNVGRSAASNAGARAATGDIVLFLDGDTLGGPGWVAAHAHAHRGRAGVLARGHTLHLRCTRFLRDPQTAAPRAGEEERVARMSEAERERSKVTVAQVTSDFASIEARAEPGIYPGAGPRLVHEVDMDALRHHPDCPTLWCAATGANFSVRRDAFVASGGFDDDLHINEHREFALRMADTGHRVELVEGARTYHLTHRTGWRDPLADEPGWEALFYRRHPRPEVKLMAVMWASLADRSPIPPDSRIVSLPELARCAREWSEARIDTVRALVPGLAPLSVNERQARA